jgi:hypothetical protein
LAIGGLHKTEAVIGLKAIGPALLISLPIGKCMLYICQ